MKSCRIFRFLTLPNNLQYRVSNGIRTFAFLKNNKALDHCATYYFSKKNYIYIL